MMEVFYVYDESPDIYHSTKHVTSYYDKQYAAVYLRQDLADKKPCEICVKQGWLEC